MRPIAFLLVLIAGVSAPCPATAAAGWSWPVRGQVVTQFRNGDDPYAAGQHRGVDIAAPVGTPVTAAVSGTVVFAGVVGSSGLVVSERSGDGRYELSYLHLAALSVRRGQDVAAGERLGAVGVSGTRSVEQPHLHFGVREAGDRHAYVDPLQFLAPPPAPDPEPRSVPVPVPEPVAAAPADAPVTAPAPAAGPAPAGAPVAAPAPAGVRGSVPHAAPGRLPLHLAAPVDRPHGAHVLGPRPVPVHPSGAPAAARGGAPHAGEPRTAQPARRGPVEPVPAERRAAGPAAHRSEGAGIDLGWLAACAGLVAAAALLAAPRSSGGGPPLGRGAFTALLRAASRTGAARGGIAGRPAPGRAK